MTTTTDRASYIAGLRVLADLLEQHDELPLPDSGRSAPMTLWFHDTSVAREQMAAAARLLPGPLTKNTWGGVGSTASYFELQGSIEGLRIDLTATRDAVCTRRVVGTREVVEEVPDPDALAAVPTVTVTKTEDVVEWDCGPILASREPVNGQAQQSECAHEDVRQVSEHDVECRGCGLVSA